MANMIRIDLAGSETRGNAEQVEFNLDDIRIKERDFGILIEAKNTGNLGFHSRFFPWSQVRRVDRFDSSSK